MTISKIIDKIYRELMSGDQYIEYLRKKGVSIGKGCSISKTANFGSEPFLIRIGDNVRITQRVQFITHDGGLWVLRNLGLIERQEVKYGSIVIGNNCNISWDATIMPNVVLGNNCIVAPGAVVTKSFPDNSILGGVPAKMIETIDVYHKKITGKTVPLYGLSMKEKEVYLKTHRDDLFSKFRQP